MEIVGTDLEEKQRKSKKTMTILTVVIVFLLIISIVLFAAIYYLKDKQFKFNLDGKRIANRSISNDLFVFQDNKAYVSLKDIASFIGYKYYNGGYKQYTEDTNKCYMESTNEITTFERSSNKIYKTPVDELDYSYYTISEPIVRINGKLYINAEDLGLACNLQIQYSQEENKVVIYTLPYIVNYYTTSYTNSSVTENFNNQKALLYGLMVVSNVDNTEKEDSTKKDERRYGINDLNNEEIVGMKYTNIEFIEGTKEFIVTTVENKVGLITAEGETRVSPQYDSLKQIDKDLNLYLASNNNKYGVIERNGKILIYLEYDEIGVDVTQFATNDIKNKYILFNNAIPVKQAGKWGLFDITGKKILELDYVSMGCVKTTSTDKNSNNVLIIPDIEGIVVGKEFVLGNEKKVYYGIYNSKGERLVIEALDTVYSTTVSGQEQYTMTNDGNSYDVMEYMRKYVLPQQNQDINPTEDDNENVNEVVNEVANDNTTTDTTGTTDTTKQNTVSHNTTQQA